MEEDEEEYDEIDEGEEKLKVKSTPMYDGSLKPDYVNANPILKPIANINNSFMDYQKLHDKAFLDYQSVKKIINKMVEDMPKYSQTKLFAEVVRMTSYVDQLIFLGEQKQEILKRTIKEMTNVPVEKE